VTEPTWSARARERIAGRPFVLVGIGPHQLLGLAAAGGRVVGAVAVLPAGAVSPTHANAGAPFPVLTLVAATRDILEVVVKGFAAVLDERAVELRAFLDQVDPGRSATVASYLPMPHGALGGRTAWAQDAAVCAPLEDKAGARATLAAAVRVVGSEPVPAGPPTAWWSDACARFGVTRLVVQAPGLSGGGTGTWVCRSPADVPDIVGATMAPFLDGMPANVSGVVLPTGATLVLPASRQIVRVDAEGRPLYAGNVTGEQWAADDREAIAVEVRAIGSVLAGRGFVGPFGVDFLRTAGGRRYHDLNPRMNGVTDSLAFLLDGEATVGVVPLLLSRTPWSATECAALEDAVHAAVQARPLARLWLSTVLTRARTVHRVPAPGAYVVDVATGTVTARSAAQGDVETAILRPTLAPASFEPGDRLVLGDLFCPPALAASIGDADGMVLIDALSVDHATMSSSPAARGG
jgi:hypothetical protein